MRPGQLCGKPTVSGDPCRRPAGCRISHLHADLLAQQAELYRATADHWRQVAAADPFGEDGRQAAAHADGWDLKADYAADIAELRDAQEDPEQALRRRLVRVPTGRRAEVEGWLRESDARHLTAERMADEASLLQAEADRLMLVGDDDAAQEAQWQAIQAQTKAERAEQDALAHDDRVADRIGKMRQRRATARRRTATDLVIAGLRDLRDAIFG